MVTLIDGSRKAARVFLRELRHSGMHEGRIVEKRLGDISQRASLHNGEIHLNNYLEKGGVRISDSFEYAGGKLKQGVSCVTSDTGTLFHWSGKKGFLGLFRKKPYSVIDVTPHGQSMPIAYECRVEGSLNNPKSAVLYESVNDKLVGKTVIPSMEEVKKIVRAIFSGDKSQLPLI